MSEVKRYSIWEIKRYSIWYENLSEVERGEVLRDGYAELVLASDYDALQKEVDGFCRTLGEENVVSAMVALLALQKENERLTRENNRLHDLNVQAFASENKAHSDLQRAEWELAEAKEAIRKIKPHLRHENCHPSEGRHSESCIELRSILASPAVVRAMKEKK